MGAKVVSTWESAAGGASVGASALLSIASSVSLGAGLRVGWGRWLALRKAVRVLIASKANVAGSSDPEVMKAVARKAGIATKLRVEGQSLAEEGFRGIVAKA
jgi:hypothetical protein